MNKQRNLHKKIIIKSDGRPWRPILYINDIVEIIKEVMLHNFKKNYYIFNIGSRNGNYKVIDIAKLVQKIKNKVSIHISKTSSPDERSYKVSFNKFFRTFKKIPLKMNTTKQINQTFKFLKKNKLNKKLFLGPKTNRILRLKKIKNEI